MHRYGHHTQHRASQHHDLLPSRTRQFGQELGVAGIGKTRLIQGCLIDRIGDNARHCAGQGKFRRLFDRRHDGLGVGRIGLAGNGYRGQRHRQHRQGVREYLSRRPGIGHDPYRNDQFQVPRQPLQSRRIVQRDEGRSGFAQLQPRSQRQFPTDPGRVAHR